VRVHGAAARETDGGRCFAEGCRWLYGFGEGVDYTEAASYLKRGAQLGHALSAAHLASILMEGKGVRGNPRAAQLEATMWAMRSCDAMGLNDQAAGGDAGARLALGLLLQAGIGCEMNQALAVNHFRAAAMAGDAVAMNCLAGAVEEGLAACARLAEQKAAVDALAKAAAKGDGAVLARVVAQYESLPGDAVRRARDAARDALAVTEVREELLRHKAACAKLERESWKDATCEAYAKKTEGPLLELEKTLARCAGKDYAWLRKDVGAASSTATKLRAKRDKAAARAQAIAMEKLASAERARVLAAQAEARAEAEEKKAAEAKAQKDALKNARRNARRGVAS